MPETRWVARLIVPILAAAFVVLYLWPDNTAQLWAWTIRPRMTPLLMGAGYIGGAYFFLRAALAQRWHHVAVGFLPVVTFSSFMTLTTVLHWDRFNYAHPAFFLWVALYATTPFVVLLVWLRNRQTDPGTGDPGEVTIPSIARWLIGILGAVNLSMAVLLFLLPNSMMSIWPWQLTPLTSRVGGGWFALGGVTSLGVARERRWSAIRIVLESQALSLILILIGAARAWDDFDPSQPLTWIVIGGMFLLLVVIVCVYLGLEARRRSHDAALAS